jgi:hypothetical protein
MPQKAKKKRERRVPRPVDMELAHRVGHLVVAHGNQRLLAEALRDEDGRGPTQQMISNWIKGTTKPDAKSLVALGNAAAANIDAEPFAEWFWERAGLNLGTMRKRAIADLRRTLFSRGSEQSKTPEGSPVLYVPVFGEFVDLIDRNTERVPLPADVLGDGGSIAALRFPSRGFPSVFKEGDILVVDASETAPLALINRLVLVSLDPFPEGYPLGRAANEAALQRLHSAPRIAIDPSSLDDLDSQAAEEAYRWARRPGYLAGWIQVHYASGWNGSKNTKDDPRKDDPWRLVLQLASNEIYEGTAHPLTGWQTQGSPDPGDPAQHSSLLPEGTQIVGRIVGWLSAPRAKSADSLLDPAVNR